jgi:hypothetical protein
MASTITAGNATNGLALSCDNTGILELKTGTGAGTTAMTINASQVTSFAGNVGIGTSSPAATFGKSGTLDANGVIITRGTLNAHQTNAGVLAYTNNETAIRSYGATAGSGSIVFNTGGGGGSADTERARIDSSGNLLVGTTTQRGAAKFGMDINPSVNAGIVIYPTTNAGYDAARFQNNSSSQIGAITCTTTGTAYNTSSDYRLKEDIAPMTGALAKVAALKPCTYKWKSDGSDGEGFIAHELAEVVPQCVTGEKDAVDSEGKPVYQGIDTSFLVATLTAAIQELKAELDATKAEVAALKGA